MNLLKKRRWINLLRLTPFQKLFLKNLITKMLIFPSIWYFVWAIYPLATSPYLQEGFDLAFYIMLSMFNWLCFVLSLLGAIAIEMIIADPAMRKNLLRLERKATHPLSSTADKTEKKEEKIPLY